VAKDSAHAMAFMHASVSIGTFNTLSPVFHYLLTASHVSNNFHALVYKLCRREKLRLILGGKGTEPFKYPPPDGYRGIGEAIHDAARERNILLAEEKSLIETHGSSNDESSALEDKKYICDLSDGEHGHELFAWQHRYYGSDASVHLGSSRPGALFGGSTNLKTFKNIVPTKNDNSTIADISLRLGKILMKESNPKTAGDESDSFGSRINLLRDAYHKINVEVNKELKEVWYV
jgi:hypothetical protein